MTASTVSHSQVMDTFDRDGSVVFRNVLDLELLAEASAHVDWLHARHPDRSGEELAHDLVASDAFWVRLVSDDRLLDIAETFIGPDIALFASHYISKPARTGQPVLWHQDAAFWPLDPMEVVTLWLAVDDSTVDNGCLRVVPGSHKQNLLEMQSRDDIKNVLGAEIRAEVDESQARDLILNAGDVEVHHPMIVHGSKANHSANRRCGLTIRYIPTSTRITTPEQPFASALLLRGEAGRNIYQPAPTYREGDSFPFRDSAAWI